MIVLVALCAAQAHGQAVPAAADREPLREIHVPAPRLMETRPIAPVSRPAAVSRPSASRLEEVTVRGARPLRAYRLELEASRDRIFEIFNEVNSDDEFDIHCRNETRTGTRIPTRVCRPRFSNDVASEAAGEYVDAFKSLCAGGLTQQCMFGNQFAAVVAMSRAQAVEGQEHYKHLELAEEISRLARDSWQLWHALLEHEALQRAYREARAGDGNE